MLEATVDLWEEPADAKCITTNGFVKVNGEGVMGAGIAGQAQRRYPNMPKMLGLQLQENGNHVGILQLPTVDDPAYYVSYPVKDVWMNPAREDLIIRSAHELMELIDLMYWEKVLLPRPGCGNGRKVWGQVKRWIEPILSDKVIVIGLADA